MRNVPLYKKHSKNVTIYLTEGIGKGSTELAAFDNALLQAGVANFNLIRLSSVIPTGAKIIHADENYKASGGWGDRLYVVWAEHRTSTPNESVWAGVGWVQDPATGEGLFVEFDGATESYVRESITHTLKDMMRTRGIDMGEIHMMVKGVTCVDAPVCAFVAAVYKSESW